MKVDRSFITDIETSRQSMIIVRNLISLGNELGLSVVVEGVERRSQVEALFAAGCSLAQGFHFARPLPASDAEGWISSSRNAFLVDNSALLVNS